jgi:hypothetical protein
MKRNMLKQRCSYINQDGKRCRIKSAIQIRVFLDAELYDYPRWVEITSCAKHSLALGVEFKK